MNVILWSGGKDSTATVILAHEIGFPIDRIVISLPFFDKERKIYADNPDHVSFVLEHAKPLFERWGYQVDVVSSDKDYLYWFHKVITKSKFPSKNGLKYGFLIGGYCKFNVSKVDPVRAHIKALGGDAVIIEGIAFDEQKRLKGMREKRGHISLLEQYRITEEITYPLCEKYGLLSPIYKKRRRQGCFFCPNQGIAELADLKQDHPQLYRELADLSKVEGLSSKGFKYGMTFDECDFLVDREIEKRAHFQQIQLF